MLSIKYIYFSLNLDMVKVRLLLIYSQICVQRPPSGAQNNQPLFRGGRYSEVPPIKLVLIWEAWGSSWLLLTGGRCLEVVMV
jgi:hypothetical protein